MKTAIMYWSKTGNTEKVAYAIKYVLEESGIKPAFMRIDEAEDMNYFDYDFVCFGFPSYQWHPPKQVDEFLTGKHLDYRKQGLVKLGAPRIPGKNALIFCTFSGPHTGINEAIPAGKYAGQFFEHLGFRVLDELYIVGELHHSSEISMMGKMGDIRGRPNEEDLTKVKQYVKNLIKRL
jgi:hypothetical protein